MKHDSTPQQTATYSSAQVASDSLFERCSWIYAFCREHLFRDDTRKIALALWNDGIPPHGCHLLEVGCGPGFYACRLAAQFAHLRVTGIDAAEPQLRRARRRATERELPNCRFEQADVCALPQSADTLDAVIASRLFTILPEREWALAEMYRVLRPGGRCFIAEPRSSLRAMPPLAAMWLLAALSTFWHAQPRHYREPRRMTILPLAAFGTLVETQPWRQVQRWHDPHYQYAVCEKR